MTVQDRLASVLNRLATGARVTKIREADRIRAEKKGDEARDERLGEAIARLEAAADSLWSALDEKPSLRKVG